MVHLTSVFHVEGQDQGIERKQHFCKECADEYFARTLPMNPFRGLICLSDEYRSKLYDLLEKAHPEAFDNSDTEACRAGSELMRKFLHENLVKDNIEMNEQAFEMLVVDFIGSHHFYERVDNCKKRKG